MAGRREEITMDLVTMIGFIAGTLTTISFLPQVHKAWRTKSCSDLSIGMLLAFTAGVVLWLVYGLMLRAAPVILANAVTLVLLVALLALKVRYQE